MARFQCFRTEKNLIRWRLLSGNNRVLGLSVRSFADHAATLGEVDVVRKHAADTEFFDVEHRAAGLWWWHLEIPDPAEDAAPPLASAVSARGFARRVDALLSVARFREHAPDAEPDWTLAVFQSGRRGREIQLDRPPPTAMRPQRSVG